MPAFSSSLAALAPHWSLDNRPMQCMHLQHWTILDAPLAQPREITSCAHTCTGCGVGKTKLSRWTVGPVENRESSLPPKQRSDGNAGKPLPTASPLAPCAPFLVASQPASKAQGRPYSSVSGATSPLWFCCSLGVSEARRLSGSTFPRATASPLSARACPTSCSCMHSRSRASAYSG